MNERRHSVMNKRVMLDWLRHCEETGEPFPSDHAIQDRFVFGSVEQARTLLADLADAGEITIRYKGGKRHITIGKSAPIRTGGSTPRPIARTVAKSDPDVERTVQKIMAIVRGKKPEPKRPVLTARPAPQPPVQPAPPKPAKEAPPMPKPIVPKRQVNLRVSAEHYQRIERMAEAEGSSMSAVATKLLAESIDGLDAVMAPPAEQDTVPLEGKPLVKVAVLRAAQAVGMDLHHFCSRLLDLGLECWTGQREAAE